MFDQFYTTLESLGIVPVVVLDKVEDAAPLAHALMAAGMKSAEVTFRTACAAECIAAMAEAEPESETYTMDLISMVEATLEDPKQVLRAQERAARDRAMAEMKADGIEYEERLERIQDVTYEKPLEDLLDAAFDKYCQEVPWANDYQLSPKSVLRDMLESASDFKGYIQKLGIARSEGILLRYLAEA